MLNINPHDDDRRPKARRKRDLWQIPPILVSAMHPPTEGTMPTTINDSALIAGILYDMKYALMIDANAMGEHEWKVVTSQAIRSHAKHGERVAHAEAMKHVAQYVFVREGEPFTKGQVDAALAYLKERAAGESAEGVAA